MGTAIWKRLIIYGKVSHHFVLNEIHFRCRFYGSYIYFVLWNMFMVILIFLLVCTSLFFPCQYMHFYPKLYMLKGFCSDISGFLAHLSLQAHW